MQCESRPIEEPKPPGAPGNFLTPATFWWFQKQCKLFGFRDWEEELLNFCAEAVDAGALAAGPDFKTAHDRNEVVRAPNVTLCNGVIKDEFDTAVSA